MNLFFIDSSKKDFKRKPGYKKKSENSTRLKTSDSAKEKIKDFGKRAILRNFQQFLENTSLHGLKYTSDKSISMFERIFFVFAFISVLILSGYFIGNVYQKWSATPIIISISPTPTYISSIPFPAVTICSMNQAKKSKVKSIARGSVEYSLLESLCARNVDPDHKIQSIYGRWSRFRNFVINVSTPCNEMLINCWFGGVIENCDDIFEPVLTDDGLCCTFNSVAQKFMFKNYNKDNFIEDNDVENEKITPIDWTPETGYPEILPDNFFPRIAQGTGSGMGLTVILNASSVEYFCSTTQSIGFKIQIHNPTTQPKVSNYGLLVSSAREGRFIITPQVQHATDALRNIDKIKRHCLFINEGNLTYFRTYSRRNCQLECESELLQKECGCFLYYMPKISIDTRLCGPYDDPCINRIQQAIESTSNKELSCESCLPACFELSYTTTVTTTKIVSNGFLTRSNYPENLFKKSSKELTLLNLFYDNNLAVSSTKDELIGFTDFLSNTGGLLGLFMGFSIFSLIEIVYFMTFRPYCAIRILKNEIKKSKKDNLNQMVKKGTDKQFFKRKSIQFYNEGKQIYDTTRTISIFKNETEMKKLNRFNPIMAKYKKTKPIFPYYE